MGAQKIAEVGNYRGLVDGLRGAWQSGRTRPLSWRKAQLRGLLRMLHEHQQEFIDALATDLGRPQFEGWLADVRFPEREIADYLEHLDEWAQPETVGTPWQLAAGTHARILREPLGVVLIIGPFNYPLHLVLVPAAAALAAGNALLIKPSDLTPATTGALMKYIPEYVDRDAVAVVDTDAAGTEALLRERYDHIFFTGSTRVGRVVMKAAAEHLTPVTLELGGKSPVIVDRDANIEVAAKRLAFAKYLNAGQTCIAPDYVLAHPAVEKPLTEALARAVSESYGAQPKESPDFGRIVNARHFDRLSALLDGGGFERIAFGGDRDRDKRYIAPTALSGVEEKSPVMSDEIFGPILPILPVENMDAAVRFVQAREKPLALYVFSNSKATVNKVLNETSSGGACINDAAWHIFVPSLPFGGVGPSGMGAYHGRWGFDNFSHRKGVLERKTWFELPVISPPYRNWKQRVAKLLF